MKAKPTCSKPRAMTDRRALLVLIAGACLIGCNPVLVRLADAGPSAVGFWRLLAALPLLALLSARGGGPGRPTAVMLGTGAVFAADLAFWHYGIHYTSVANATVLSNLTPVLVTVVGWLLFAERPRPLFLLGMAVAVGGAVGMGLARHGGVGPGNDPGLGDLLSAATAVWYGLYFLGVRRVRQTTSTSALMLWTALVGLPLLLGAAVLLHEPLLPASALGWAAVAGLGLVHVSGQGSIAWALGRLPVSLAAVVVLVQPVVAALLGWAVFGEAVTPWQAVAGALALAGVALAQAGARRTAPIDQRTPCPVISDGEADPGPETARAP